MMEFTHQNLNKDMNSSILRKVKGGEGNRTVPTQQDNQFRDFLSIVDNKFTKAQQGTPAKQ